MTGLTDFQRMQLEAHHASNRATELGLTAQDVRSMSWEEYNRLFGYDRPTPAEAARAALEAQHAPPAPAAPPSAAEAPESEPQGIDISQLDPRSPEYAALRQQLGMGGREYGAGIFAVHGSWADAARAKAGRSAMAGTRNVVEPPRLTGRYVRQDDMIDHRPAHMRLSNQANMWQGR